MPTFIRPQAVGFAGEINAIAIGAFNDSEILTAVKNGSGNLELIAWRCAPTDTDVTRVSDSGSQAGSIGEVALSMIGRTAITAVRNGSSNLFMILWDVPVGLGSVTRTWDSGTTAGEASRIAMALLPSNIIVTAVRNGSGNLELISWRLEPNGTLSRLNDSGSQAGSVSRVTITAIDNSNIVTAVRNGSGNLELIGWRVASNGAITRWGDSGSQAGSVSEISITTMDGPVPTNDVLTTVRDGSGNLLVISWRPDPASGSIERLPDGAAGTASDLSSCFTVTDSGPKYITAMRNGSDNPELIAFDIVGAGASSGFVRTGDYSGEGEVTATAMIDLGAGRLAHAMRVSESGHPDHALALTVFRVSDVEPVFILPRAEGTAGEIGEVALQAFNDTEILTAVRNGSGNLELIGWLSPPTQTVVTRISDSGSQAGAIGEVALALIDRTAITAVRSGSNNLLMILWDVPAGMGSITRIWDSGTSAGEASNIAMTVVGANIVVTAVRNGSGILELISWQFEADGTLSRLHDSGSQAGAVSWVAITAIDSSNVITAVRNGSGNLELIGWGVAPNGAITRWAGGGSEAGAVSGIALTAIPGTNPASDVLTSVVDGAGNLKLIAWRPSPPAQTIERLFDREADAASALAVCSTTTASGAKLIASRRAGSGTLELNAYGIFSDDLGSAFVDCGDFSLPPNNDVTATTLAPLGTERIVGAIRISKKCKSPSNQLSVTVYDVFDPPSPAPANILEIDFQNPVLPSEDDSGWAESGGHEFPLSADIEWMQALDHSQDYEKGNMVGCTGWVVAPDYSGADAPFDHPFGFDWEFQVALDDDKNGYQALLSPANINPQESGVGQLLANEQGLPMRRGLLGVEWDGNLIPQSFKARVRHGDRIAAFGRWILDTGHNFVKFWRTEIHPPLLLVSANAEKNLRAPDSTRALFMSRPYLPGQHYAVDPSNAYLDSVDDDGPFLSHLVNELVKVITLRSRMVEAHPKIKSAPFEGSYRFAAKVRPPAKPSGAYRLAVSFQFTVRDGCSVEVAAADSETVEVMVTLNSGKYTPPKLPTRRSCVYSKDELNALSPGTGKDILAIDILAPLVGLLVPFGGLALAIYIEYVLQRGFKVDAYDPIPEIDVLDSSHAVFNTLPENIPSGAGVVVDNTQPYPIFGWLDVKWIPWNPIPGGGTKAGSSTQTAIKKKQPAKKKRPTHK
ncbi:MAG TPA: hypothetical protein VF283_10160 [Bryobacteraceae bacterium]